MGAPAGAPGDSPDVAPTAPTDQPLPTRETGAEEDAFWGKAVLIFLMVLAFGLLAVSDPIKNPIFILFLCLMSGVLGAFLAKEKGRRPRKWGLVCGLMPIATFFLIIAPDIIRRCPNCGADFAEGQLTCEVCCHVIPHPQGVPMVAPDRGDGDAACPHCGFAYRIADYNPKAKKAYCEACQQELFSRD